ncbi:hypothetical protein [Aquisphaera insulae]|uniref:hypothetical protein n=1 Tax=Aquisphaera insulae TaxID=2712864 RepID=UPI0013EAD569|nr:hypothetical protein [Aquisphaera insulae]
MRRKHVLSWAGLAVSIAAGGCGTSTGGALPPSHALVAEADPIPSKPASRAGARARGPQARPAQFLDPRLGK